MNNLKSNRTATHMAPADESSKTIACCPELQLEYGDLQVLNDERHAVFCDTANKCDFMECDGLATATNNTLLLNEGKIL